MRLHAVTAGAGPLVVLLHGFPEFWYGFRRQIPALVAAGYRVLVPDLRGYGRSSKPRGVRAYVLRELVRDVAELIVAAGGTRAHVVGHDWGGGIGWGLAMEHPGLLERLAILNCPHPERFSRGLFTPRQLVKSWYMGFFQLPWLPEHVLSRGRYAVLREAIARELVPPSCFTDAEYERYVEAFSEPGALRAMLAYYRAGARLRGRVGLRVIEQPVLVLWGELDRHLRRELAEPSRRWVPNARVERLPDASHWLHHERAEQVNARLIAFFDEAPGA